MNKIITAEPGDSDIEYIKSVSPYKHVIVSQQFTEEYLAELFASTTEYKKWNNERMKHSDRRNFCLNDLRGWVVIMGLREPSTRTRFSHLMAAKNLGARVEDSESMKIFSSAAKGESLEHTILTTAAYCDILIGRFENEGDAVKAVKAVEEVKEEMGPRYIINAGDGKGQHPTQALLDVYTIQEHFGRRSDLKVAMVGDLARGRTVHSLTYSLAKSSGNEFYFVAPENSQMPNEILEHLRERRIKYDLTTELEDILKITDVVYMTRVQKERFGGDLDAYAQACGMFRIDTENVELMPKNSILMHPLPISSDEGKEILPEVDYNPRAVYLKRQVPNGLYTRMAILKLIQQNHGKEK